MIKSKIKKSLIILLCGILLMTAFPMIPQKEVKASVSESASVDNSNLLPIWSKATNDATATPNWLASAIIAEVNLDHVSVEGTLSGAYKLLDYYEELGVNCLWVLPVNDKGCGQDGTYQDNGYINKGLHTIDLKLSEADSYEEGWNNFADFVTAAHNRNIRILLDVVPWGVSYDSPMAPLSENYDSQYADIVTNEENDWNGYSYNYGSTQFQSYYKEKLLDIIQTTGIDGIRADLAPWTEGQTDLLNEIRQASYAAGYPIVIMSEGATNNQITGGDANSTATTRTYDLEQMGVIDMNNHDDYFQWDEEWLAEKDEETKQALLTDNWTSNVYAPVDWWYENNIVETVKDGSVMAGTNLEQKDGQTGEHQYYTYALSFHDYAVRARNNTLSFGYQAIFAPVIPLWYMGDELADEKVNSAQNVLYFSGTVNMNLLEDNVHAAFYNKIKKYIQIRRTYSDIFENFAENHKNSNICKVSVSGVETYQAYARYANQKAVLVVPNGTEEAADITVTIPVSDAGIGSSYTVKNLMTDETITASNDQISITVAAGDLAVILVDGNTSDATTGCEEVIAANKTKLSALSDKVKAADKAIKTLEAAGRLTGDLVSAARTAYDALSAAEKLMVDGYALVEAEKKYAMASSHNNVCYENAIQMSDVYPNVSTKADWTWGDDIMTMEELEAGGVKVTYQSTSCTPNYRVEIGKPVQLDGAHLSFSMTEKVDGVLKPYEDRQIYLSLASSHGLATSNNKLRLKISPANGGQVFITSGGTSVDHSGMPGYDSSYSDRIFLNTGFDIEMKFRVTDDGNLIINLNGYDLEIKESDLERATELTDLDNVYFYFEPGRAPEITMHYLHEADDVCITDTCDSYRVTEADINPNSSNTGWASARTLMDTEEGLRVTQNADGNNLAYRHNINQAVSVDGAHMKLTVHSTDTSNPKDARITLYIADDLSNAHKGIALRLYVRESYLRLDINDSEKDVLYIPSVFSKTVSTLEIKSAVTSNNDVVFTINGYEYVVSSELWASATGLKDLTKAYFLIGPREGKLDYTWHYFHGGDEVCYDEVRTVENLITIMEVDKTSENAVSARKAYWALTDEEKVCVENRVYLDFENEEGCLLKDEELHLMTESRINPNSSNTGWASVRTLTDTEDGLRVIQNVDGNNLAYRHNISQAVSVDGAHMKLTVHSTDTSNPKDARITIYIADDLSNAHKGIALRLYVRESYLRLDINDSEKDVLYIPSVFSKTVSTLEIKSAVTSNNDVVFTINGYEYVVSSELWASATGLKDLTKAYFLIGPREGKLDYTWHYFHGGEEVCWPELSDVETKIELCHPTMPIKANVDPASKGYDALNEIEQELITNASLLASAVANIKENDLYYYGLTTPSVSGSDSWKVVHGQVTNGYNIDYSQGISGMGKVYRYRFNEAITLNGAHIGATLPVDGTNSKFFLSLSNTNDNGSVDEDLCLKIDLRGGANFLYADGAANMDTSGLFGYNGVNNDRIKFPSIGTNELDIRFYVDVEKSLYITVNGYYIKVTQKQLAGLEDFNVDKPIYIGVSPDGTKPNITVNYIVSGSTKPSYDEITGDVNNDAATNSFDLVRMKRYEAAEDKNSVMISYYRSASDLDGNGTIGDEEDLKGLRLELAEAN